MPILVAAGCTMMPRKKENTIIDFVRVIPCQHFYPFSSLPFIISTYSMTTSGEATSNFALIACLDTLANSTVYYLFMSQTSISPINLMYDARSP